ncbi:hypothetical protein GMORB2_3591 [Geosmithia morbida]|uniref:Uncharacterized protein n=1 Tax=Geosmithia morbida TaxID=1094350 RepID=A0A9P4YMX1_9HYPO|nr:uncharacterized protein GMORB2_3591 [Geosmithia morbida]KAF4119903.1 hypothetical protein GMORB2_3591 [Geosmithia morbida]
MSGRGPSASGSPATSTYQVNVNRTKTRKWVEAKVQNYDGDDWGSPESDEDEPESPPPAATAQAPRPAAAHRLPSESRVPGSGRASPIVASSTSTRTWDSGSRVPSISEKVTQPAPDNVDPVKIDAPLAQQAGYADQNGPVAGADGGFSQKQQDSIRASRRTSKSPQLPDVTRMSGFGPDFFLGNSGTQNKPVGSGSTFQDELPQSSPTIPASDSQKTVTELQSPWQSLNPDVTPTEPLQPKKPEQSPSSYEPEPLQRQTTLETTNSSPLKESDVLSQEIMRTLTPAGLSASDTSAGKRTSQGGLPPATHRESSYSLSGYDDYWADAGETSTLQTRPTGEFGNVPEKAPTSTSPRSLTPAVAESSTSPSGGHDLRRKFSWEDAGEEVRPARSPAKSPVSTAPAPTSDTAPVDQTLGVTSPAINIIPEGQPLPAHKEAHEDPSSSPAIQNDSLWQPLSMKESIPEPSSPGSETRDRDVLASGAQLSSPALAGSVSPTTPTPESIPQHGDAAADFSIAVEEEEKIMSFRDIMFLTTPAERIAKFSETRDAFWQMESGLHDWITAMKDEFPEHANAGGSYSGSTPPPNTAAASGSPGMGQQFAGGPNGQGGSARSRLAGFPIQAGAVAGNAFGHSGGQIGTKGKEFMQSAGKMGKGLFSKGRSKLRGDKDGSRPNDKALKQQQQEEEEREQKTSRRKSWALSLGDKLRTTSSGGLSSRRYCVEPSALLTQMQENDNDYDVYRDRGGDRDYDPTTVA